MIITLIRILLIPIVYILCIIFALLKNKNIVIKIIKVCLYLLGINKPSIFGQLDPNVDVILYNHPSFIENLLKVCYTDRMTFLMSNKVFILIRYVFNLTLALFNGVVVSPKGNENTVYKMKENIRKYGNAIAICPYITNINRKNSYKSKRFPKFKTGAFRISNSVQPLIFLFEPEIINNLIYTLPNYCIFKLLFNHKGSDCSMIYLKTQTRRLNETVEEFAERVRIYMNDYIQLCQDCVNKHGVTKLNYFMNLRANATLTHPPTIIKSANIP